MMRAINGVIWWWLATNWRGRLRAVGVIAVLVLNGCTLVVFAPYAVPYLAGLIMSICLVVSGHFVGEQSHFVSHAMPEEGGFVVKANRGPHGWRECRPTARRARGFRAVPDAKMQAAIEQVWAGLSDTERSMFHQAVCHRRMSEGHMEVMAEISRQLADGVRRRWA